MNVFQFTALHNYATDAYKNQRQAMKRQMGALKRTKTQILHVIIWNLMTLRQTTNLACYKLESIKPCVKNIYFENFAKYIELESFWKEVF